MIKVNLRDSEIAEIDRILKEQVKPKLEYLDEDQWEELKGKFDQLSQM